VVRTIQRICDRHEVLAAAVSVIADPPHKAVRQHLPDAVKWNDVPDWMSGPAKAREIIADLVAAGESDPIVLISYNGAVLDLGAEPWDGVEVQPFPFRTYKGVPHQMTEGAQSPAAKPTPAITPVSPAVVANNNGQSKPVEVDRRDHRSRRFGDTLAALGKGPFSDARPQMCVSIASVMATGQKLTVTELVAKAATGAESVLVSKGVKPQPWAAICPFMERLLLEAGALTGADGKSIPVGWESPLTVVQSLADDWVVKIEAEIVLALIDCEEISEREVPNVARALHHNARPEAQMAVRRAIIYLFKSEKVEQLVGQNVLRRKQPQTVAGVIDHSIYKIERAQTLAASSG